MGRVMQVKPSLVELDQLPEYPIEPDARLDTHEFLRWEYARWLASDMRWNGTHECKSMWFELVNLSYNETPVGTLPNNNRRLARMIQPTVEPDRFDALCALPFGPRYGWVPCRAGDDIRLMHPVVTRIVLLAFASRATHAARVEAASNARRLKRLTDDVMQAIPALASDPRKIRYIDTVIQERIDARGGERRTAEDLDVAIRACLQKDREGGFPNKP